MKKIIALLASLFACAAVQATTATGQCAVNFAPLSDVNPWTNASYSVSSGGTTRVASGVLRPNTTTFFYYSGASPGYSGSAITVSAEVNASAVDDEPVIGALDENGDGFMMMIRPTQVIVLVLDNYVVIDSNGSATITLAADDLFTFTLTKGTPNSYSATRNGVAISLSATTYPLTLSTMRATWEMKAENVGTAAVKSLAVVAGLTGSCSAGGSIVPTIYRTLRQQKQ